MARKVLIHKEVYSKDPDSLQNVFGEEQVVAVVGDESMLKNLPDDFEMIFWFSHGVELLLDLRPDLIRKAKGVFVMNEGGSVFEIRDIEVEIAEEAPPVEQIQEFEAEEWPPIPVRFIPRQVRDKLYYDFLEKIEELQDLQESNEFLNFIDAVDELLHEVHAAVKEGKAYVLADISKFKILKDFLDNSENMINYSLALAVAIELFKQTGLTFEAIAHIFNLLKIAPKVKKGQWTLDQVKYYYRLLRQKLDLIKLAEHLQNAESE